MVYSVRSKKTGWKNGWKMSVVWGGLLLAVLTLALAGCSGKPQEVREFARVAELAAELGEAPKYVESFGSGFRFSLAGLGEKHLALRYNNPETGEELTLYIQKEPEGSQLPPTTFVRQAGDVLLTYYEVVYKYVPTNYEPTEADEAAVAEGRMQLAVGTEEVEENVCASVIWQEGSLYYELTGLDLSLSGEEMLDMAAEVVQSE